MTHDLTVAIGGTTLTSADGIAWMEEFNGTGAGQLRVPVAHSDAALVTRDAEVVVSYKGTPVGRWVVERITTTIVGEAGTVYRQATGRGLLCVLEDGLCVYFVGGEAVGLTRPFNLGSVDTPSEVLSGLGGIANAGGTLPDGWPDSVASWIRVDPGEEGSDGTYLRGTLTAPGDDTRARIYAAGSGFSVLLDGEMVISTTSTGEGRYVTADIRMVAGAHTIVVVFGYTGGKVALSVRQTDLSGALTGSVLLRTGLSNGWQGAFQGCSWRASDVLAAAMADCADRDIDRIGALLANAEITDSAARVWREWPASTTVLSLAADLVEFGMDVWVDAGGVLRTADQRGGQKEGVALTPGVNIQSYTVEQDCRGVSWMWNVWNTGVTPAWAWTVDSDWATEHGGRREGMIQIPDNLRLEDVDAYSRMAIDAVTREPYVRDARCVPVDGCEPFLDFEVGDWITVPDADGEPAWARVLSIAIEQDGEGVAYVPSLELGESPRRRYALEADGKYAATLARQVWGGSMGGAAANAVPPETAGQPDPPPPLPEGIPIVAPDEPTNPNDGQVWVNPGDGTVSVWDPDAEEWVEVGGGGGAAEVYVGEDWPPEGEGLRLWADPVNQTVSAWDETAEDWLLVGAAPVYVGGSAPAIPGPYSLWVETTVGGGNYLYVNRDSEWQPVEPPP